MLATLALRTGFGWARSPAMAGESRGVGRG